jgi:hypothetical protein
MGYEMKSRLPANELRLPVALWEDATRATTYAIPIGPRWSGPAPVLDLPWHFLGVLPMGTPVEDLGTQTEGTNDLVQCRIAGRAVMCGFAAVAR